MIMKLKVRRYNLTQTAPVGMTVDQPSAANGTERPTPAAEQGAMRPQPAPPQASAKAADVMPLRRAVTAPPGMAAPKAAAPAPAKPANLRNSGPNDLLFEQTDDGFGGLTFDTARGPAKGPAQPAADLEAIKREGLTGRQLRGARRMAQKMGLPATSDFDAVRLLRAVGVDPLQRLPGMGLDDDDDDEDGPATAAGAGGMVPPGGPGQAVRNALARAGANLPTVAPGVRLPQKIEPIKVPATVDPEAKPPEFNHAAEIMKVQEELARRRRRRVVMLAARLAVFVILPTVICGIYFGIIATPMYSSHTEFVIQQAEPGAAAGGKMGGLLSGTTFATTQDAIAVQGYLQSSNAMTRLDQDNNFRAEFSSPHIDPIQRLMPDATKEDAYRLYQKHVKISYDPTEGIIKMDVIAPTPDLSVDFSKALIRYAEEQVDQLTQRLREDQMKGARDAYSDAEKKVKEAQSHLVKLQEKAKVISSDAEVQMVTAQIGKLEDQITAEKLSLAQMEANAEPNRARMDPVKRRIATLEEQIASLREKMTAGNGDSEDGSLANIRAELLMAEADVQTRQMILAQSLQSMETSRLEANRQVRYLSLAVTPVAPQEAAYPRAFENTLVALVIFAGLYLMISMTAAILREQVSS